MYSLFRGRGYQALNKSIRKYQSSLRLSSCGPNVLAWDISDGNVTPEMKLKIEKKWQKHVNKSRFNENDEIRPKAYILSMFPYPSGALHMGHVRVYAISDTIARFHRMKGYNVLHPMGWDAFGLPAENAAMERGEDPAVWTEKNIQQMRKQLDLLGYNFDWDHEISTCHPDYYKWTQHIFLRLFKAGLVYRKPELVNWDPVDKTVLADEQIDEKGNSWRSGAQVEKVLLTQWFIKATKFAKSLSEGLKTLNERDWQDVIKIQNGWIGNVNGFTFDWAVSCSGEDLLLPVWTSTPEIIGKVTFIAVTFGSILDITEKEPLVTEHIYHDANGKPMTFKVRRLEAFATNPISEEKVPIFVVDGLLPFSTGSEAYMGVPSVAASDETFASTLGIRLSPQIEVSLSSAKDDACDNVCSKAQHLVRGGYASSSSHKDWLISRQRYWGTPIPILYCDECGTVPVPEDQLPVCLPPFPKERSNTSLGSPLLDATSWLHTTCPRCGGHAVRETDTLDTFVDSSWYYLRFIDSLNKDAPFCPEKVKKFMPVDVYVGGKEHAVLHMYYARLICHFLHREGLVPYPEPFRRLIVHGMVMGQSFRDCETGQYLKRDEVNFSGEVPCCLRSGKPVTVKWEKMSKSKYNGIDPTEVVSLHGADTTRVQILAGIAPTSDRPWSLDSYQSSLNLLNGVYQLVSKFICTRRKVALGLLNNNVSVENFTESENKAAFTRNEHLSFITFNYGSTYQLMIVLTRIQSFIKDLNKLPTEVIAFGPKFEKALATLLIALAPVAPHFASELWEGFASAPGRTKDNLSVINWDTSLLEQPWPELDGDFELPVIVKVNHSEVCTTFIAHEKLEKMNKNEVLQCVLQHTVVNKCLGEVVPTIQFFEKISGFRAIIDLHAQGVKINPLDFQPRSSSGKEAVSKLKRKKKKVQNVN